MISRDHSTAIPEHTDACISIAWCGWSLRLPSDWRPLKIKGEAARGSMMLGDAEKPILLIQWRRTDTKGFDAKGWLTKRFDRLRAAMDAAAPTPDGIDAAAWARDVEVREGVSRSIWCGYSSSAGMLLEVLRVNFATSDLADKTFEQALAGLHVSGRNEPCRWALYGFNFVSPPGFELARRHLFSGDIALGFQRGKKEALLLRHVYPARMALSRRTLNRWLEKTPFKEHRRPVKARTEDWAHGTLGGISRRGWRRLPAPVGWCNPRYSTAIAAVDAQRDRILIVEHLTRTETGPDAARSCLEGMNR